MIRKISIRDFATIEHLEIELSSGLSIITGETGAGKSIIVEAMSLALGSRADSAMVRGGKKKATIQMILELPRNFPLEEIAYLQDDDSSEVILAREISANGKSVARINGLIVTLAQLAALAAKLADIHGQYDHQSLFKTEKHLELIDSFHESAVSPLKEKIRENWRLYKIARNELDSLLKKEADTKRRLDFMRYELAEIQQVDPKPGEDTVLKERLAILQNSGHIFEKLSVSRSVLYDSPSSAHDALGNAMRALQAISDYSKDLEDIMNVVSDCYYAIEDLAGKLRTAADYTEFSPESLDETISRLDKIEKLTSKYGGSVDSVLAHKADLTRELGAIENIDTLKSELADSVAEQKGILTARFKALSVLRKKAAAELETKINEELLGLNFRDAHFEAAFDESLELGERFTENGADLVEFRISTNKGQPLLPLAKVASGGEMSRMMLAFKSVIGNFDNIQTMIFDEIDNGISGVTASIVGKKLLTMAKSRQIICITHLPQIAACGREHLVIEKSSDDSAAYTSVRHLADDERAVEIARLLGGSNITGTTLKSAKELISLSNQ